MPAYMADKLQHRNSAGDEETSRPAEFITVCVLAFVAGVLATVYFCRSMCCEMEMPGGWTMSMMWMRMPGHTWLASATTFLLMWLAMMIAMMLPSALPTILKTRRAAAAYPWALGDTYDELIENLSRLADAGLVLHIAG